MDNAILESYRPLYNSILEKPLTILELFKAQFGEDKVELQGIKSLEEFANYCIATFGDLEQAERSLDTENRKNAAIKKRWPFMQDDNIYILVYFPEVRVTNENNRHVDITKLWVRVTITLGGTTCGRFTMFRSEYNESHWISDYAHSHLPGIVTDHFYQPCTGSGPINGTITTCSASYQEDFWRLYCYELSLFVKVESLAGTPHRRLENIRTSSGGPTTRISMSREDNAERIVGNLAWGNYGGTDRIRALFRDFVAWFVEQRVLTFGFDGHAYFIGMPARDFRVMLTNKFIEWYNTPNNPWKSVVPTSELFTYNILRYAKFDGRGIVLRVVNTSSSSDSRESRRRNIPNYQNRELFTFKGETIRLHIITSEEEQPQEDLSEEIRANNYITLLDKPITEHISTVILRIINGKYGESSEPLARTINYLSGETETSPARNVLFL